MEGRVLTCVYCGHEYPQNTPSHGDKVLTDHIAICEKHPMQKVIKQRDRLRAALEGLIGASTAVELDAIEIVLRSSPAAEEDRAAALNAIHALKECAT